jgi:hypothetical protein
MLAYKQQASMDKYNIIGLYALNYPGCSKRYLGQTEKPFGVRFKEHFMHASTKIKIQVLRNTSKKTTTRLILGNI